MGRAFLYEVALYLLALIAVPRMLFQRLTRGKYKNSLAQRFGFRFPKIDKGNRKLIWLHAVSLGETKAIAALAKKLKNSPDHPILIVSSTTETGHAEAKKSLAFADYHVYLPVDFFWIISPIIRRTAPDLVILSETDLWYNFLRACKLHGGKIAVVNGKLSLRSMQRFKMLQSFAHALYDLVDLFCVQNHLYRQRYQEVGVPLNKIVVTGNLKFDEEYPVLSTKEKQEWKEQLGISPNDLVLVIGSSHDPEEQLLLTALKPVWKQFPHLKVLLVPRHPERFDGVADLLAKQHLPYLRYTNRSAEQKDVKVLLIDAMGVLRKCYQLADIAIVAGSYIDRVGGHNIIEPCGYGVPVLFGPHMHTQTELVALVEAYRAGLQVPIGELADTLIDLLGDQEKRKTIGQSGERLIADMKGATDVTLAALSAMG